MIWAHAGFLRPLTLPLIFCFAVEYTAILKASWRLVAAGLFCINQEVYLQFPFCPCPMLAEVDRLDTDTWCQCTTGYSKVLFEKAFGCDVEVELQKSVKMGHDVCLMKIIPQRPVWK